MGGRPRDPSAEELGSFHISCFSFRSSVPVAGGRAEEVERVAFEEGDEMRNKSSKSIPSLEELVAQITPETRHDETDFGVEGDELI